MLPACTHRPPQFRRWFFWEWHFQDVAGVRFSFFHSSVSHFGFSSHNSEGSPLNCRSIRSKLQHFLRCWFWSLCRAVCLCGAALCGREVPCCCHQVGVDSAAVCRLCLLVPCRVRGPLAERIVWHCLPSEHINANSSCCCMASCGGMMKIKRHLSESYDKSVLNDWAPVDEVSGGESLWVINFKT